MKRLRVPPLTDVVSYPKATVFKIGLYLGMTLVLLAVFVFACYFIEADVDLIRWATRTRFSFLTFTWASIYLGAVYQGLLSQRLLSQISKGS